MAKLSDYGYEYDDIYDEIEMTEEEKEEMSEAFIEWVAELQREYYSEPRAFILNIKKLQELKQTSLKIIKYIKEIDANAKITYEGCDANVIPVNKNAEIIIETDEFYVKDIKTFLDSITSSSYISFVPTLSNTIKIFIGFKDVLKEVEKCD